MKRSKAAPAAFLLVAIAVTGCDPLEGVGPGGRLDARNLTGEYSWQFQRFDQGSARGYPLVELAWEVPTQYNREVFRVYARRASSGDYGLIATVTSCSEGVCRYTDTNVTGGQSYDYYVATFDERDATEIGTSEAVRIQVPLRPNMAAPGSASAVSLDGAVFVRWGSTEAQRYMLLARQDNGTTFLIGETDGLSFLDTRAVNGSHYRYFVAAVDRFGHVSSLSTGVDAFPRPDYHADLVHAHSDHPAGSGFRFVVRETDDPVVAGTSPAAQWRLEVVNGIFRIVPLNGTGISNGIFTTQLTCGPGSDADCVDVRMASTAMQFGTAPVVVETGFTYVLRVIGSDNRTHYGKIRVQGTTVDNQGRRLMVFDWAYQLRPDERSLNLIPGA